MTSAKELADRLGQEAVVVQQEVATGRMEPRATMIEAAAMLRRMDEALNWISEGDRLPTVGETVLLAHPRQFGEWWDIKTAWLGIAHESVFPRPVKAGDPWPTDYSWRTGGNSIVMVSGNSWWAALSGIPLPPKAVHHFGRTHAVKQVGTVWVPRKAKGE